MFQPPVFQEDRPEIMQELITRHPFATIVAAVTGALTADHVPLVLKPAPGQGCLQGHMAVNNPLFRETKEPFDVLTIFQGPQTYVTPSWYASKAEHGKVVPTWSYVVVHVRGTLRFVRKTDWLLRHLDDLTRQHESHRPAPWAVADAPSDFVHRQLRGLVGFEIAITSLQGTWKVSQNKAPQDRDGVTAGLAAERSSDAAEIARLVAERARQ